MKNKFKTGALAAIILLQTISAFAQIKAPEGITSKSETESTKIAPDSVVVTNSGNTQTTNTLGFTVPAGTSRLLLVSVSDDNATNIVSVSFNGIPLVQAVERDDTVAVDSFWYLLLGNGAMGTTANIVAVSSGATPNICSVIAAYSLVGVDQMNPITDTDSAVVSAPNVGSTLNITSGSGDVVFDLFDGFRSTMGGTITPQMGQTPFFNIVDLPALGGFAYYGSTFKPGTAATSMTWTSTTESMIHVAVNVNGLAPTAANVSLGGRVLSSSGYGLPNAFLQLTKPDGSVESARSNTYGYYKFENLVAGETYFVSVQKKGRTFMQPIQVVNLKDSISDFNFVADP